VVGHFAGLGLIFIYARSLETNAPIDLHGVISLTPSIPDLTLIAASVLICMILSAFFQFASSRRTIELVGSYEEYLFRKAVSEASQAPIDAVGIPESLCGDRLRIRVIRDARSCSQILSQLISNFIHLLFFVTFIVFAFWISWVATAAIVIIFILFGAILYKINIRGAGSSLTLERLVNPATREKLNIIDRFKSTLDIIPEDDPELEYIFKKGVTRKYLSAYRRRMSLAAETQFLSGILGAFIICSVLFIFGMAIFFHGGSWSTLLTYLIALRLILSRLMRLATTLTSISRLYPNAKRFFETEFDTESRGTSATEIISNSSGLRLPSLHGEGDFMVLRSGEPVAIASSAPLNRSLVGSLLSLMAHDVKGAFTLIMPPVMSDRRMLRSVLGIARKDLVSAIEKDFFGLGFEGEYQKYFSRGMKTKICDVPTDIPKKYFVLLGLIAAKHKGIPLIFVDDNSLPDRNKHFRKRLVSLCGNQVLFVRISGNKASINFYKNVIVVRGNQPVGWTTAEWLTSHPEVLRDGNVGKMNRDIDLGMEIDGIM
jgi:ABC-type multidrug transport system fused ATPase/permease subunit